MKLKLTQLHAARELRDLAAFPGNRLEALADDRRGQHSIRVNDQYRICFVCHDGDADNVAQVFGDMEPVEDMERVAGLLPPPAGTASTCRCR